MPAHFFGLAQSAFLVEKKIRKLFFPLYQLLARYTRLSFYPSAI
jgi:hypothetical protein